VRNGYVRRCERCNQLSSDQEAADAAELALGAYTLPQRPVAWLDGNESLVCPRCEYRPRDRQDPFDMVAPAVRYNAVRIGIDPQDGLPRIEFGSDDYVDDGVGDTCFLCPRCHGTFDCAEDMDYEHIPEDPALASSPSASAVVLDRITPRVEDGEPFLGAAQVRVSTILQRLAAGASLEELQAAHVGLEAADVRAALEYAAWRVEAARYVPSGEEDFARIAEAEKRASATGIVDPYEVVARFERCSWGGAAAAAMIRARDAQHAGEQERARRALARHREALEGSEEEGES
jgi:uncharacterized protein (DUF433 family)/uncharacterized C2H2 Zn-finger protein